MKKLLFFALPFFCLASFAAGSMNVFVNGSLTALKPSATNAVLITAKSYTDTQIAAIPAAHDYSPDIATASNAVLSAAKTYASSVAASSASTASDYALSHAKTYSDTNTLVRSKAYTDSSVASKLSLSGGTMTGALNMGSKKITNLATPTSNADASTKQYVDNTVSSATASCIKEVSGGITIGESITFSNEDGGYIHNLVQPDEGMDAANKDYVDAEVAQAFSSVDNIYFHVFRNIKVLIGTGSGSGNPPRSPNNLSAYTIPDSRTKIALTNLTINSSCALGVDVLSPNSSVSASVGAGNASYCTIDFDFSSVGAGNTVSFYLLVTVIFPRDYHPNDQFNDYALVLPFYFTHTVPLP